MAMTGQSGSGESLVIDNDHIFADAGEMDTYFMAHPSELVADTYCSVASTLYKYVNSAWVDVSAVIKGEKGDAGAKGTDGADGASLTALQTAMIDESYDDKHTHSNADTLNAITNIFSDTQKTKVNAIEEVFTSTQKAKVDAIEQVYTSVEKLKVDDIDQVFTAAQSIKVNAIEEVFSATEKAKLGNMTDHFKGVFANSADLIASTATYLSGDFATVSDTDILWYYSDGAWHDSGASAAGDMLQSIFDPTGIASDAFDRENHHGTQAISTILNLQTELNNKATTINLALATDDIEALDLAVQSKADQSSLDATNDTADALALAVDAKASQSDFDALEGKFEVNTIAINLKATKEDLSALDERVETIETENITRDEKIDEIDIIKLRDTTGVTASESEVKLYRKIIQVTLNETEGEYIDSSTGLTSGVHQVVSVSGNVICDTQNHMAINSSYEGSYKAVAYVQQGGSILRTRPYGSATLGKAAIIELSYYYI